MSGPESSTPAGQRLPRKDDNDDDSNNDDHHDNDNNSHNGDYFSCNSDDDRNHDDAQLHKNEVISVKNQMNIQTIPGKAFLHFRVTLDSYQKVKKLLVDH